MKDYTIIDKISALAKDYSLLSGIEMFNDIFEYRNEATNRISRCFVDTTSMHYEFIKTLEYASDLYLYSVIAIDKIIDEKQKIDSPESLLLSFLLREKSLRIMYGLFPPEHEYWLYFDKYNQEFTNSMIYEVNNQYVFNKDDEYNKYLIGKGALVKASITALLINSKEKKIIENIEKSIDYYQIGVSIIDDVKDWKKDLKNKQPNFLINNLIESEGTDVLSCDITDISKILFFKDYILRVLRDANSYFDKAINCVDDVDLTASWINSIIDQKKANIDTIKDIECIILSQIDRANIQVNEGKASERMNQELSSINELKQYCLSEILSPKSNTLKELEIINHFPSNNGFEFKENFYRADIFQRAILVENLRSNDVNDIITQWVDKELEYFAKKQDEKGGWKFYNDFYLQPCDVDTTAQIIKVLVCSGGKKIISQKTIEKIDKHLRIYGKRDGGVSTWFLPTMSDSNELELEQRRFYEKYIGLDIDNEVDVEVVANLAQALYLYDKKKYSKLLQNFISHIERKQFNDGHWKNSWYWGYYYGILTCLKAIVTIKPQSDCVDKSEKFLLANQNIDGGWGRGRTKSDPLNTSLALICLELLAHIKGNKYRETVSKGFDFILKNIKNPKSLKHCNFINFQKSGASTFISDSITKSYVYQATILWMR